MTNTTATKTETDNARAAARDAAIQAAAERALDELAKLAR